MKKKFKIDETLKNDKNININKGCNFTERKKYKKERHTIGSLFP
jgi:hypothetical protein